MYKLFQPDDPKQKLNQEALDQMVQTVVHAAGKNSTTGKTRPTM